jgi:two-component system, LuxR family, sensor kinase FixL
MKRNEPQSENQNSAALRRRVEQLLLERLAEGPTMPIDDVRAIVQDLATHQTELEIRNDELREVQRQLASSRDSYADLYDTAPVGYLTLNRDGLVLEANLTVASMLGVERRLLTGASLSDWIQDDSQESLKSFRRAAFAGHAKQRCELLFSKADGTVFSARLDYVLVNAADGPRCRIALIDNTEKRRTENEIKELNEELKQRVVAQYDVLKKLSIALSQLNEGVFITSDPQDWSASKIVYSNAALCRITGYAPEELQEKNPSLLYGEMTDRTAIRQIAESLSVKQAYFGELIVYQKDGTPLIAEIFVRPLFGLSEDSANFIAIVRDLTERKRNELELRHEIEFNDNIINLSPFIVLLLDKEGRILRFNPAFERLSGWKTDEVIGSDWFETFLPERDREKIRAVFHDAIRGDRTQAYVNPIVLKNGNERDIEWYDVPLTNLRGELIGLLCSGQDITERRRATEALHESEQRMKAILATAADAIVTIDSHGTIDSVNSATERMFGYSSHELIGQNVKILMPSPYADEHDGYLRRYLKTGEARIIGKGREVKGKRKDGTVFPVDLAVSEIDHLGLFTGIIRDITERAATQQKLLETERLAAIGEAMAGLAHESRNALQRGQACLDLLKQQLFADLESMELIQSIQRANEDLYRLYEEVRAFAAPVVICPQFQDITSVVKRVWHDLEDVRRSRKDQLLEHVHCEDVELELDPFSMNQVFRNILENALQACCDPAVIQIHYSDVEWEGEPAMSISIRDNGPGIPPDAVARVFDSFYTTRQDGTGLGLAITQRIVKAHGGQIVVNPDCPAGAEFVIMIPRRRRRAKRRAE